MKAGRGKNGRATRALVIAAGSSYVTNVVFGAAVAVGLIDNRRIRWVHHALFIATSSLTGAAIVAGVIERRSAALPLAAAAVPLIALPRTAGLRTRHIVIASAAAPAFVAALVLDRRRP